MQVACQMDLTEGFDQHAMQHTSGTWNQTRPRAAPCASAPLKNENLLPVGASLDPGREAVWACELGW
jgi:hypothetical protein